MSMEEFYEIVEALKIAFVEPWFLSDEKQIDFWYSALKDIPFEIAKEVAVKCAATREDPPKIATIRKMAAEITAPETEQMNENEAWALVSMAMRNGTYGAEKEFEALPEPVQMAVGSPANLREWGQAYGDSITVIQSNFQRSFRAVMERRKDQAAMPVLKTLKEIGTQEVERIGCYEQVENA